MVVLLQLKKTTLIVLALISSLLLSAYHFLSKDNDGIKPTKTASQHWPAQTNIIFYNRIPKTGSTTFTNAIAYDLCALNGFHVVHLNLTRNRAQMSLIDQAQLVPNISNWQQMQPLFLHGHTVFIEFNNFGSQPPIWINLVREPFERFLSHYYFLRYGDNFRVGLKRSKAGNNETFDECFERSARECDPKSAWIQIAYFCGSHHFCTEPGSQMALELAKRNLLQKYLLVGITERMEDTIGLLEQLLPSFFKGAAEHFRSLSESRKQLRHTLRKFHPSVEVERAFKAHPVYQMEKEFYDFAVAEFDSVWRRTRDKEGHFLRGQFHFEKIRP